MAAMNDGTTPTTGNNLIVTDPSTFAMAAAMARPSASKCQSSQGWPGANYNRVQHANAAGHNSTLG